MSFGLEVRLKEPVVFELELLILGAGERKNSVGH